SDFDLAKIQAFCKENEIEFDENDGPGKLIEEIFSEKVEAKLIQDYEEIHKLGALK
ncbi:MAG: hypothetical protein PWQ09_1286, partial [Candidatus Cloacimonadota bacterium]|nr:hypothetical protein [Candidatus Cloacimonadota bacterium]